MPEAVAGAQGAAAAGANQVYDAVALHDLTPQPVWVEETRCSCLVLHADLDGGASQCRDHGGGDRQGDNSQIAGTDRGRNSK